MMATIIAGSRSALSYHHHWVKYHAQLPYHWVKTRAQLDIAMYVFYLLGVPGNLLSAIVWLRDYSSSAIYLAAFMHATHLISSHLTSLHLT